MAAILPDRQEYVDDRAGNVVGIHLCTLVSASDTITVPKFAQTATNSISSRVLVGANAAAPTVTDDASSDGNTVTIAGTIGDQVLIVTRHSRATINFGDED